MPRQWKARGRVARSLAAAPAILCALSHHSLAQDLGIGITGTIRYYSNDEPVPDAVVQLTGVGTGQRGHGQEWSLRADGPRRGKRAIEPAKTGDVQLGKLIEDGPEDYYPWA